MQRREVLGASLSGLLLAMTKPVRATERRVIVSRIALVNNRVVMAVTISGKGPYLFLIDTGGESSIIDAQLARELQLKSTGLVKASGVGGSAMLNTYAARDVVFGGGIRQPVVSFLEMKDGFRQHIRGALAAGILTTTDSDLDIEAGEWRIFPDGAPERLGAVQLKGAIRENSWHDRTASSRRLYGAVQVNNGVLDCLLDTGAHGFLSISRNNAQRLGLWDDTKPFAPKAAYGIGGSAGIGRVVRADAIVFAGQRFDKPLVHLQGPGHGTGQLDGIVGLTMLQGFNMSTEPRTRSLWLQRHKDAPLLQEPYGLSGLWLEDDGKGVRVAANGTGSPAAEVGIVVGDRLPDMDLKTAIATISGPPGKIVELPIARDRKTRTHRFELRHYL